MSGQLNLVPPIMVAVSCAVATSRLFSVNYYDKISILRNLPYLPDLDARCRLKAIFVKTLRLHMLQCL